MKFILYGNSSSMNRGCEAILESTIDIMDKVFGESEYLNAPPRYFSPEELGYYGVRIKHLPPPIRTRFSLAWFKYQIYRVFFQTTVDPFCHYLPEAKALLAIGGDNYSLDYGKPRRYLEVHNRVLKSGVPLVIWGASIGPFSKDPDYEKYITGELRKVNLICARESETVDYLKSIGVEENVRLVADPAFALSPVKPETIDANLSDRLEEGAIGLNFSPIIQRYMGGESDWMTVASRCLDELLDVVDCPLILIPHVIQPGNDDREFMKKVLTLIKPEKQQKVMLIDTPYRCREMKWIISQLKAFIGARTHATIAALSSCVPTISIGYSMKARGINQDIYGHQKWLVPSTEIKDSGLAKVAQAFMSDLEGTKAQLTQTMPSYREGAYRAAEYIKEIYV